MSETNESPEIPLVVAVVLTWNDTEMTTACVESVVASDYPSLRVLLVDNGSDTPCGQQIHDRFPSIDLLTLPTNQGFSGGANRGIERALEMGAQYVHLIGNDSVVERQAISTLVEALADRPDAGGASPLLLFPGKELVVQFYTASLERDCARHVHHHVGDPFEGREWPTVESEFIPCVAIMFRSKALRDVGLFDETFGTSWEDYDLCIRLKDAGWKYIMVGATRAVHGGSVTTGRTSPYITYYYTRNRLVCLFRYGRPLRILRRGLFIARTYWWQIRQYGLANWACHVAFAKGILHFLFGIRGESRTTRRRV